MDVKFLKKNIGAYELIKDQGNNHFTMHLEILEDLVISVGLKGEFSC